MSYLSFQAKFEAEMRDKGRLSQTETEEEEEEAAEDVKKKSGKTGTKKKVMKE
jgi:hypothetical protein